MDYGAILRERVPGLQVDRLVPVETGWDSAVVEINGEWIFRFPRRPEVVDWFRAEAALLPELAPRLPAPIPQFELVDLDKDGFVGYRKLAGEPLAHGTSSAALGARVGEFLAALHAFPVDRARRLTGRDWAAEKRATVDRFRTAVLPLLDESNRRPAAALLDAALAHRFEPSLVHGDLGPEHLLHRGDELAGVIDWSDARVGDPAIDFAWLLYGTSPPFAEQLLRSYGRSDETLRERALVFHRLGPWHEVLFGLEDERPELVASGLEGIRARLL
jgi:aminoglycoside phosphotransferase (APT) family kinase protein